MINKIVNTMMETTLVRTIMDMTIVRIILNSTIGQLTVKSIKAVLEILSQVSTIEQIIIFILWIAPIPVIMEAYLLVRGIIIKRKKQVA